MNDATPPNREPRPRGILVCGAGVVGLAVAIALAQAGWPVTLLGPRDARRNGRTVALLEGSVQMLRSLGAWAAVRAAAAPLAVMRLVDATDSLFAGPPVSFAATEVGLGCFGYNVENAALTEALEACAGTISNLRRVEGSFAAMTRGRERLVVTTREGATLEVALLVAADGADSPVRHAVGIGDRQTSYPQVALTTILRHGAPHRDTSTEFHTRQGPFTLVPMPDDGAGPRSSLVWVMTPAEAERRLALTPAELAGEIDRQAQRLLGTLRVEGRVGRFPIRHQVAERLTADRVALVGEAAHALPPIGAQGLNLSLRDAATLVDQLAPVLARDGDPGEPAALAAYAAARRGDVALRAGGVDALNRSLLTRFPPADAARSLALRVLARSQVARRLAMTVGLAPGQTLPSLMRGDPPDGLTKPEKPGWDGSERVRPLRP